MYGIILALILFTSIVPTFKLVITSFSRPGGSFTRKDDIFDVQKIDLIICFFIIYFWGIEFRIWLSFQSGIPNNRHNVQQIS